MMTSPTGHLSDSESGAFCQIRALRSKRAFTLIELIMVLALLAIIASLVAPALGAFFRGRILDSEGRRMLALTKHGRERAISEGIPMLLWIDAQHQEYGLQAEPGFTDKDPKALAVTCDSGVQIEVPVVASTVAPPTTALPNNLPAIRFMPDGSLGQSSPLAVAMRDRDGGQLWLAQARNRMSYELRQQKGLWNDTRW